MVLFTKEKPEIKHARSGYSYFIESVNGEKKYCNKIFKSISAAIDSFFGSIPDENQDELTVCVFNVSTGDVVKKKSSKK
jgi:hypothetical protein